MANPLKLLKLKPTAFQFIHEIPIDAPPARVWNALLNMNGWFHFEADRAKRPKVTLEPHLGGRFMSESRDGSVSSLFGFVAHLEPEKLLRINGTMGMSHVPVNTAMIWELQPRRNGKTTLLRFCQRTFGFLTGDVKSQFQNGWGKLHPQLKALAEKKTRTK